MVTSGMILGVIGMIYLTISSAMSTYLDILPALLILGFGMGLIMPASMQTATLGAEPQFAGVASATVNTNQQIGGSFSTALLNTLAATATADCLSSNAPAISGVAAEAAIAGYTTAYWWGAGLFLVGGVVSAFLLTRRLPTPVHDVAEPVTVAG